MKKIQAAACWVVLAAVGCGGTANSGGSEVMTGGTGGAAGSAAIAGSAGMGGSSAIGTGGSGTAMGGASGSVGSAGSGALGTPGYPSGSVILCFGAGCPFGECDNDMFFADKPCSSVYTSDVGPSSTYCSAAETGSYCLETGPSFGPDYAVSCANGMATVLKCNSGCGSEGAGYHCSSF
jgi:hypothetical protein